MDQLTINAAAGMRSRIESLDMLANNLSNTGTAGYKADREFFTTYLAAEAAESPVPAQAPDIERNWIDFTQGTLTETHGALDFALAGRGFFVAEAPHGTLLTRNGGFRFSKTGVLETLEGYPVRAVAPDGEKKRIQAQPSDGAPIKVAIDGVVTQGGTELGRLLLVDVPGPEGVIKQGASYFRLVDPQSIPKQATDLEVLQGRLEGSNVTPAESAIRLVSLMRQFEMLQRAVALGGEMNRKTAEEVARVTG